jgi:acyl-CoA reductase-like NAD-dependent aldehyde dehydrogenase
MVVAAQRRTRGWMERLADALEARLEDFAQAESRDGGQADQARA